MILYYRLQHEIKCVMYLKLATSFPETCDKSRLLKKQVLLRLS